MVLLEIMRLAALVELGKCLMFLFWWLSLLVFGFWNNKEMSAELSI